MHVLTIKSSLDVPIRNSFLLGTWNSTISALSWVDIKNQVLQQNDWTDETYTLWTFLFVNHWLYNHYKCFNWGAVYSADIFHLQTSDFSIIAKHITAIKLDRKHSYIEIISTRITYVKLRCALTQNDLIFSM